MPTTPEFDNTVDRAAVMLLHAMRENATAEDQERWADAAMYAAQVSADHFDGESLPIANIDVAMCAIAGRARDLFADAINRRERLSQEMRAFLIAEFAKLLDAETERICAYD